MAIALPVETTRQTADRVNERGSIQIIGDDELLVRALDRLLRQAGFEVGIAERGTSVLGNGGLGLDCRDVALTIVDLPDQHDFDPAEPAVTIDDRAKAARFLWIGSNPPAGPSPWFLAKPFSTEEFLLRVKTLLAPTIRQGEVSS